MKKMLTVSIFVLSILLCFQTALFPQERKGSAMVGLTVMPSFSGPGIGIRLWSSPSFGWGLEGMSSWNFSDYFIGRARVMLTLSTSDNHRWYGLLTAGYMAMSVEAGDGSTIDFESPTVAAGVGIEWLWGMRKNWGFSLEAGYQYGDVETTWDPKPVTIGTLTIDPPEETLKVPWIPVYIGFSLAYYF